MDKKNSLFSDVFHQVQSTSYKHLAVEHNQNLVYKESLSYFSPVSREKNQLAGWDKTFFQRLLKPQQDDTTPPTNNTDDEKMPTWRQNRKLLVRVFIIWIMLAGYMLLNVLSNKTF